MTNPGLCGSCTHARIVETKRDSRFYLCELSFTDPAFARYPPLPVVRCSGYKPRRGDAPVTQQVQE